MYALNASERTLHNLAKELRRFYKDELGPPAPEARPFSVRRALMEALTEGGLQTGYEAEICRAAALVAGRHYEGSRLILPFASLAQRDLLATSGPGAYLKGTDTAPRAIDVLRAFSPVARAGITLLDNLRGDLALPRFNADPEPTWLTSEGATITDSQPTLGQVAMSLKSGAVFLKFSRQLLMQAEAESIIGSALLRACAALLDRAVIAGSGASGEPQGIASTSGVETASGTSLSFATLCDLRKAVLDNGADEGQLKFIGGTGAQAALAKREKATGSGLIWSAGSIDGIGAASTSHAPTATLVLGGFTQVAVGVWGAGPIVELNPYSAFQSGQVECRVILDADVAVLQAGAFGVVSSIT